MSNSSEEINRKFDIIADHLATLAVSQQKSEGRITRLERVLMLAIRAGQRERKDARKKFGALTEKIEALAEAQRRTEEALAHLAEAQARTDVALAETDERLNNLINVVERSISEGRNGKS